MEDSIPEITCEELARSLEAGKNLHLLDIRTPDRIATMRIELVPPERSHQVVGDDLLSMIEPHVVGVEHDDQLAVICNRGIQSRPVTQLLRSQGYEAASVRGGMAAWMTALVERPLVAPEGLDHLIQFDRIGKGSLSYVLVRHGEALLIDPPKKGLGMLEAAARLGARVIGVADTHAHADYISGGPLLSAHLGVPYYLHAKDAVYPYDGRKGVIDFVPMEHFDAIPVGDAEIEIDHTPGHTEGSCSFRLGRRVVFTGDFIFIDSVGRPDLGDKTEAWTKILWKSLERTKAEWPGALMIMPAHYASDEERNSDRTVFRTLSRLREDNRPLRIEDEETFTDWVMRRTGSFPEAYRSIKAINLGLLKLPEEEEQILEIGRNACALG
ncbi:MAG: MBL fold metallo-hydrolase [Planctomycetota bacterium]